MPRSDPRARSVARLGRMRAAGADASATIAMLRECSSDVVQRLEHASRHQKVTAAVADEKFAWHHELDSLLNEETELCADLLSWVERHAEWTFTSETLEAAGSSACPDASLVERHLGALTACDGEGAAALSELDARWTASCTALGVGDASDPHGGWTDEEHGAYQHACNLWVRVCQCRGGRPGAGLTLSLHPPPRGGAAGGLGGDLGEVVSTLLALAGGTARVFSRAPIVSHHAWCQQRKAHVCRRDAAAQRWGRDKAELLRGAERDFLAAREEADAQADAADERATHDALRCTAHRRLAAARARKAVEDAMDAALAADLQDAQDAVEESVRERKAQAAADRKVAIAAYKASLVAHEARLSSIRKCVEAEARSVRVDELAHRAERVEARRELLRARADRARALEAQEAEVEADRAAALDRLVASVPYASRMAEIAEGPSGDRLAAPTASSAASAEISRAYAAYLRAVHGLPAPGEAALGGREPPSLVPGVTSHGDLDVALAAKGVTGSAPQDARTRAALLQLANTRLREQGLFGGKGYTDKQVTGDQRWRFVSALRAAGAAAPEGSTARQALANLNAGQRGAATAAMIALGGSGLG